MTQKDWLMNSGWQSQKQNVILIHGYAGGEYTPPVGVLKDGNFNLNLSFEKLIIFLFD